MARYTRPTDPANTAETRSLRSRGLSPISAGPRIVPDRRIERTTRSEHWKANPFRKASGSSYPRRDSGLRSPDAGPDARYNPCRCFCECTTRPRARHDPPDNRYAGNNIPGCNCRPAPPSDRPLPGRRLSASEKLSGCPANGTTATSSIPAHSPRRARTASAAAKSKPQAIPLRKKRKPSDHNRYTAARRIPSALPS